MAKTIDFVYMAGDCPSDGCPECFFDHRSSFNDEYKREAFLKARDTIRRYSLTRTFIPDSSPLRTEEEIANFVDAMQESVPDCHAVTTIFSCRHGKISYQRSIRFPHVQDIDGLVEKIRMALPIDLKKQKNRSIQSYLMPVKE